MKKLNRLNSIAIVITLNLFITADLSANWISNTQHTPNTRHSKSLPDGKAGDSLPGGVTQDWLNSLRDENGNKIIPETDPGTSRAIPEDPEGDAMQRKIFNGFNANDRYGSSISSAGDLNGDGYEDIIVGAFGYSALTGRAYVYFGGMIMNTVPDIIMTGEAANNYFGFSVSTAGDLNGDGYSDVIVGAYNYSFATGRAYVFFGGASMDNAADMIMTGEGENNNFGESVSTAGDVNGDGYSDLIIGAKHYSSFNGKAYIFFGGAVMNNVADVTMTGEAAINFFGNSVSTAGDVNGDGYSDVIIGARGYSSNTGRVYVFFGGAGMNNAADVTMTGEASGNQFGFSVSTAGDVNGDGYSDVIIGADYYSSFTGRAYVFFGGAGMNNSADVIMTGEGTNNFFGTSISAAGDVNGDGYSDVIIGALGHSSNTGRVYVYFGSEGMNNVADVTITGEATGNRFGSSVSAGDVNGDGYSDVAVGAYGYYSLTGRAYVYDYFMRNEIISDITMTGEATLTDFGQSVSSAGDVNGDGYSDVIVGARTYSSNTGRAYIYFGGASMDNIADVTMTGEAAFTDFGQSVASAGDVNGDGYSDVIVGARAFSSNTGRAYVFYGGASMNNTADVTMTGEAANNYFGNSVSTAGDVNGDGYSDVIVGAYGYSSAAGRAYIYFGGASMDNFADVTMTGEAAFTDFGQSVSSAGDVNGDGYSDVIVGARTFSSNTGRAYVFYGSSSMNNTADVTMTGEAAGNYFGYSVSSAGDVNGDGYSDVIVGAYGYSSATGRAYVFYGGASMNNTADVTVTGEAANNYFGNSVSSAGDVNRDGYDDVIVGAYNYSNTGKVYICFGGSGMNNTADVTMTGEGENNYFGYSVSSAGDVNRDGYSDVIAGAYGYTSNTGRANTYLGSAISAKPILNYVRDVPNDQGGKVILKWARSSYDVTGNNLITGYSIFRSLPPTGGNFAWQELANITPRRFSFYSYIDNTPFDSNSNNTGNLFYMVRANTADPEVYWNSAILSGRSIDNIAPLMVSPFAAAAVVNDVRLTWNRSSAPDLLNYVLYRNTSPTIDPETEPVFATTTDSTYLDTSPLSGTYYYFIVAQDIHNNKSPVAVTESPNMTLNLTMFIEGFYNAGSDSQVSDTITVELRNSTSPFAAADQSTAVVSGNGTVQLKFANAPNGNYYIAVKHRNSIETWSANAIAFSQSTPVNYDLSSASSQAYGNNMIQVDASPVRFAIFGGDVNQDGTVDVTDLGIIDNDVFNFTTGYVVTDLTGDNNTDISDLLIADNNASKFVGVIRP